MTSHPPSMDCLLSLAETLSLSGEYGREEVKRAIHRSLEGLVSRWRKGEPAPDERRVLDAAREELRRSHRPVLRHVVNATGIVLHTNLGRAPLSPAALSEGLGLLKGYTDLEMDLETHERGHRDSRLEAMIRELLGTERTILVVNNNAAAVMLTLHSLCAGKECLVSRGELVEIGGGFRMPEVMGVSGARLREVGTTNRTRVSDFRRFAGNQSGLLLKVHTSNYKILGFTEEVSLQEMVDLGRELGLPVAYDLGSGLIRRAAPGLLGDEPDVESSLLPGLAVLSFSADKLLGGCQAGILLVEPSAASAFQKNPMLRALRVDKVTYSLLGATVDLYRRERYDAIPALSMLGEQESRLRARASAMKRRIERLAPSAFSMEVVSAEGRAGAGTAPLAALPSPALAIRPVGRKTEVLEAHLRTGGDPPVVTQLSGDRVLIHLRTLLPGEARTVTRRVADFEKEQGP